jgi:hypothetical protein
MEEKNVEKDLAVNDEADDNMALENCHEKM